MVKLIVGLFLIGVAIVVYACLKMAGEDNDGKK